jgi:AMMECR1 domain-containing protein
MLRSLLKQIIFKYKVFSNEKIITAHFLHWARGRVREGAFVYIHLETQERWLHMQGGRLIPCSRSNDNIQFVISSTKVVEPMRGGVKPIVLYTSIWGCVYEFPQHGDKCLRHGLSHEERQAALRCTRIHLTQVLANKERAFDSKDVQLLAPYQTSATVDVMLWMDGEMRGSIIHTGSSLLEALCDGVVRSARDGRYKPIAEDELPALRIEINILSDVQLPLLVTHGSGHETLIQPQYGYMVSHQQYLGWYLPVIFNVKKFSSLSELLQSLAIQKAGIPLREYAQARFFTFPIEIFRESMSGLAVVGMRGSLCEQVPPVPLPRAVAHATALMARWLCAMATEDGYIPRVADPYARTKSVADWGRMAFASYALGVFGRDTNDAVCARQAAQTAAYIRSQVPLLTMLSIREKIITQTYLARLAVVQDDYDCAVRDVVALETLTQSLALSVITDLQMASLYTDLSKKDVQYTLAAQMIIDRVYAAWQQKCEAGQAVSLAEHAELIPLLHTQLATGLGVHDKVQDRYAAVCQWYHSLQLENGAFPNTTKSDFPYTRGTSKIWEALAVDRNNDGISLKASAYILALQYHAEALAVVPSAFAPFLYGAIMHDEVNHEAWIDSVSHVLIAVTRMTSLSYSRTVPTAADAAT